MKVCDIHGTEVHEGIAVALEPYPHIVLGEGGNKRATWIALGKRDAADLIAPRRIPCPNRRQSEMVWDGAVPAERQSPRSCEKCGTAYGDWQCTSPAGYPHHRAHPDAGMVDGALCVQNVGVIALKDAEGKPNGKYLIVAPRNGGDNRVLVLWRVSSGYRGGASITAGEGVTVIASDSSWHSGRGNLGETAEMLAILKPGQELSASRSGRRVQDSKAKLVYDGKAISVTFGGEEMEAATADEVEGKYL